MSRVVVRPSRKSLLPINFCGARSVDIIFTRSSIGWSLTFGRKFDAETFLSERLTIIEFVTLTIWVGEKVDDDEMYSFADKLSKSAMSRSVPRSCPTMEKILRPIGLLSRQVT